MEETAEGLYHAEATFANFDQKTGGIGFLYFDRKLLDFGKTITVQMGAGVAPSTIFTGRLWRSKAGFLMCGLLKS